MNFSINKRLTILGMAPVLLLAIFFMAFAYYQSLNLVEEQAITTEQGLMDSKRAELKSYTEVAQTAIQEIYESGASLEQGLEVLKKLKYGQNGYFFGYNSNGVRLLLGSSEKGIGENFWDLRDSDGVYLIREFVQKAKSGGGYVGYRFPKPGKAEPELKLSYVMYLPRWDMLIGTGFYLDDVNIILDSLNKASDKSVSNMINVSVLVVGVFLIVAFVLSSLLKRSIMSPINKISESMKTLSSGEGDLTARLDVVGSHEISKLAERFNAFISTVQGMIIEVSSLSNSVSSQSQEITSRIGEIDGLLQNQQKGIEHSASAMTEMSSSANEIATNTSEAADVAVSSKGQIDSTEQSIINLSQDIKGLSGDVSNSNDSILALENNVNDIISVVGVIQSIAEQTNLLALNAAIEAARAGDQGRGFAVVADEVRTLATRTQSSTLEVKESIEKLQTAATEAVEAMQQSFTRTESALDKSQQGVEELERVTTNVNSIQEMNLVIATAAEEQSKVCAEINQTIVEISDNSQQTANIAQQNNNSAKALLELAESLKEKVGKFKVS